MKKPLQFTLLLATTLLAAQSLFAAEPVGYYNSAVGMSDEALMTALRDIIRDHKEVSYSSGLLSAFRKVDTDSEGYIIDIYSNCRYKPNDNGSSASHVGEGYNREHSFPRSWFGGEVAPMNTDVFHVYPTDIKVNSQRANYPYGVCDSGTRLTYGTYVAKGKLGASTYPGYSGTVFEPDDEYKGDLARTYFYMATCYKFELPSWPGSPQLDYRTNGYKAFSTWTINMLMEWTRMDPVSEKEIKRNEGIYGIQGNRNPFIDHPELAEYIWGDKQGQMWTGGSITPPVPTITTPANGSYIDLGSTAVGTELHYTFNLKGEGLSEPLTLTITDNEYFHANAYTFTASDVNNGTSFIITFVADEADTYTDFITISSNEASTTFSVTATAIKQDPGPDPSIPGDSIMEDWEGCATGGYWNKPVQGHAWLWDFTDAGIWGDNIKHGELCCRFGKTSSSAITMAEDFEGGTSAIAFWAASYGNDDDATLRVDFSTDKGLTWIDLGSFTVSRGALQQIILDVPLKDNVRFRIVQTSGMRVNVDDIIIYGRSEETPCKPGDVNCDGEVNIADVNIVIDHILSGEMDDACDVNKDLEVNIADVNFIIGLILNS